MIAVETYPTLAEAARAMGQDAAFLGGGTILMREVNAGEAPARIIRSTDPALHEIRTTGDTVRLGAGVTMSEILASPDLAFLHPVARLVGGPQVRNMATVGGNLLAPHPYGDLTVALIALGASVVMAGQGGARRVEEIVRERSRLSGLVASIDAPRPRNPHEFGFHKVARVKPKGVSILSIAALLPREGSRIRGARIALGGMGPYPMRGSGAERALEGNALDAQVTERAARSATEGLDPPTDALASAWYRREVAGVHLRRLLERMERG